MRRIFPGEAEAAAGERCPASLGRGGVMVSHGGRRCQLDRKPGARDPHPLPRVVKGLVFSFLVLL